VTLSEMAPKKHIVSIGTNMVRRTTRMVRNIVEDVKYSYFIMDISVPVAACGFMKGWQKYIAY
jgi:hypothetical protein